MAACPRAQHINDCCLDKANQSWRYISFIWWLTNMAYDSSSKRRRRAGAILFCLSTIAWICMASIRFTRLTTVQKIQLLRFDLRIALTQIARKKKNARKLSRFFLDPPVLTHSGLCLFFFFFSERRKGIFSVCSSMYVVSTDTEEVIHLL